MTLIEFITKWNGKGIDFDGMYGDQCMDLMHQYIVEVLGFTDGTILSAPAAKDVYQNYPNVPGADNFDKIDNTPINIPQQGDIIFWGSAIGPYGHVAIFIEGDANRFSSFDQNWNAHQYCETVQHTYAGVLGWLRKKNILDPLTECLKQHTNLVDLCNLKDKTIVDLAVQLKDCQNKPALVVSSPPQPASGNVSISMPAPQASSNIPVPQPQPTFRAAFSHLKQFFEIFFSIKIK